MLSSNLGKIRNLSKTLYRAALVGEACSLFQIRVLCKCIFDNNICTETYNMANLDKSFLCELHSSCCKIT